MRWPSPVQPASRSRIGCFCLAEDSSFSPEEEILLERRLYFATAYAHLRHGCPVLAIETLQRLPHYCAALCRPKANGNPTLGDCRLGSSAVKNPADHRQIESQDSEKAKSDLFDWSTPLAHVQSDDQLNLELDESSDSEASIGSGPSTLSGATCEVKTSFDREAG